MTTIMFLIKTIINTHYIIKHKVNLNGTQLENTLLIPVPLKILITVVPKI